MARLPAAFDARAISPVEVPATIPLTFGSGRSHGRWTDVRHLTWAGLGEMLGRVEVGPKDGPCYTQGTFSGTRRVKNEATRIEIAVLDSDTGQPMEELAARVRALGWRAILHSTHSHLTTRTQLAAEPYDKWLETVPKGECEPEYLRRLGYVAAVAGDANIVDEVSLDNPNGKKVRYYVFEHPPCPKFRLVLHLDRPWLVGEHETPETATAIWKGRIEAVAHALGLNHDQSCVDTSRLFYLPRRRSEQSEFLHLEISGSACPIWNLPDAPSTAWDATPGHARPRPATVTVLDPTGLDVNLTRWAGQYALRFEVAEAIRVRAPDLIGVRKATAKLHIECPNVANHTTDQSSRSGTFAVNASDMERAGLPGITSGFTIQCLHSGCAGTDRLGHLAALLRSGRLSVADLTDDRFLMPAVPLVDASRLVRKKEVPQIEDEPIRDGMDPRFAIGLPGVLGEAVDYILAVSTKPQPILALGAVLTLMAGAIGRKTRLGNVRPNLYIVGLAKSGAGKQRPLTAVKQMAASAGLFDRLIGVEEMASDAGIVSSVHALPSQAMLVDEIGFLLAAVSNLKNGAHVQNIVGTLMKLYSSSDTVYKGKSYADAKRNQTIDQPCVSLYGTTVPRGFYSNLSTTELTGGLLSRVMLFDTGGKRPRSRATEDLAVPRPVVDWLRAWDARPLLSGGLNLQGGAPVLNLLAVPMTPEAQTIMDACRDGMEDEVERADARGMDALYVRVHENALKLALIRACAGLPVPDEAGRMAIDPASVIVDADTARWACDLSLACTRQMEAGASGHIADSDFERKLKKIAAFARSRGDRGVSMSEVLRDPSGKMPQKALEDLLQSLVAARDLFYMNTREGKPGRPRHAYIHRDFINPDFVREQEGEDNDDPA